MVLYHLLLSGFSFSGGGGGGGGGGCGGNVGPGLFSFSFLAPFDHPCHLKSGLLPLPPPGGAAAFIFL